ncbi:MAG TPA: hypothetical protein VK798_03950 [Alloacidobacterium sp.]|jgi:hypothetical protein|nr:hypothetical protein [Alloacidobacterium sp.]
MDTLLCQFGGVCHRSEFGQVLDGAVGEARQHIGQVLADRHTEFAAALDDAEDGGDFGAGFLAADVQPIPPADRNSPDILPMSVMN